VPFLALEDIAESCSTFGRHAPHFISTSHLLIPLNSLFAYHTMASLLRIASRVEAAVAAYITVRDFANKQEWRAKFKRELVSVVIV
jgi:hypothetical protein